MKGRAVPPSINASLQCREYFDGQPKRSWQVHSFLYWSIVSWPWPLISCTANTPGITAPKFQSGPNEFGIV
jgi:hypothetical protein